MHRSHVMSWLVTIAVLSSHIVIERPTSGSTYTPTPAAQALPPQQATAIALAPPMPLPATLTNPSRTPASAQDRPLIASLVEHTQCDGLVVPPQRYSILLPIIASNHTQAIESGPVRAVAATTALDPLRAATLRGRVCDRTGVPLAGVEVTILNHAEYGSALTTATGSFKLEVNGGELLTLDYAKDGYLPLQREVLVKPLDDLLAAEAVLTPRDPNVTPITLGSGAPIQVARGSVSTDTDGTRQATLIFPASITATLRLPNGSAQSLANLHVRATEYTVGADGPKAMPGQLPPASGYTYAVALDVDEAVAAGAHSVEFSQPVYHYLENFLEFPVGMAVPSGYYDKQKAAWIASEDGRVVKLVAVANGLAELDTDGDGSADNAAALGITEAERQKLATLYQSGQSLWRVPIPHFSDWDFNWPFGPDCNPAVQRCAPTKRTAKPPQQPTNNPICRRGSIIECQNQTLGEMVGVTGTPFVLRYGSDRVPGYLPAYTLDIPLSDATYPPTLRRIELEVLVAGRRLSQSFTPAPNLSYRFTWDGKDSSGRSLAGQWPISVRVGYTYGGVYLTPAARAGIAATALSFGHFSFDGVPATGDRARQEVTLWQDWDGLIGSPARDYGLGGWSLNQLHAYDSRSKSLLLGSGERRSSESLNFLVIDTAVFLDTALSPPASRVGGVVARPDGAFFVAAIDRNQIYRVDTSGHATHFAGVAGGAPCTGGLGSCGDGGPATQARLNQPTGLALGPDGSLYIADTGANRIRKIGPDGIITTVAGNGQGCPFPYNTCFGGDNGSATQARLAGPNDVAFGSDGNLYIADTINNRIRQVDGGGIITTVAGSGAISAPWVEGARSTNATLPRPNGITLAPDGTLLIVTNTRIAQVAPDGRIWTVAGTGSRGNTGDGGLATASSIHATGKAVFLADGSIAFFHLYGCRVRRIALDGTLLTYAGNNSCGYSGDGAPAQQGSIGQASTLAAGPSGDVYVADYSNRRVRHLHTALPNFTSDELVLASEDGGEVYVFSSDGRHLRTVNALTGASRFTFAYNAAGRLVSITDGDGDVTRIERDASGRPAAIVSQDGQRTTLGLDGNGYLARIANPAGEAFQMSYGTTGLLSRFADPRGNASTFGYDDLGLLQRDTDAVNGFSQLTRGGPPDAYSVGLSTAMGRTTTFQVLNSANGTEQQLITAPDGTQSRRAFSTTGTRSATAADGATASMTLGPDPRWAMNAPLIRTATLATPGGLSATVATARTAALSDPSDPFSMTALDETVTVNGRVYATHYDAASRTFTSTTPAGRQGTVQIDAQGRALLAQTASLLATSYGYDARGRLTSMNQGSGANTRTVTITYNPAGYPETITDPLGRVMRLSYDAAGRVTRQTTPDGRVIAYTYDANGNLASLTPPGRTAHTFTYTPVNLTESYTPPDVVAGTDQTSYSYNLDGQLTRVTRPDGATIGLGYDSGGRLGTLTIPRGAFTYGYDATTGNLATVGAPGGIGLAYSYDGLLLKGETWSGPVAGSTGYSYDSDFRVSSSSVNGGNAITFQYDGDSLLKLAGDLTLSRNTQNGLLTGSALGGVSDTWSYNGFAEPISYTAKYDGATSYDVLFTRDKLGRVITKTETLSGTTTTYGYGYDLAGRLTTVTQNGAAAAAYTYDSNGNRTSGPGVTSATYDAQDRLLSYGANIYAYTANGELQSKTVGGQTTTYQYDELGSLLNVTLPSGTQISYLVDGQGRRIGRRVNGTLTQGWLYEGQLRPVAELDSAGAIVSRFVYAMHINVPDYMIKGGVTYRLITDQLGSPRLVVNVADGSIAQRIDYDEFGRVLTDTNKGFQPFGFAGGLYDAATGLVRFGARDYDVATGRWTAKDPIGFDGEDTNLYAYVGNEPVNQIDPEGLGPTGLPLPYYTPQPRPVDPLVQRNIRIIDRELKRLKQPRPVDPLVQRNIRIIDRELQRLKRRRRPKKPVNPTQQCPGIVFSPEELELIDIQLMFEEEQREHLRERIEQAFLSG
jgi:RHS repeat-associated protein